MHTSRRLHGTAPMKLVDTARRGRSWLREITGRAPDLASWRRLGSPDLCTLDLNTGAISEKWGAAAGLRARTE